MLQSRQPEAAIVKKQTRSAVVKREITRKQTVFQFDVPVQLSLIRSPRRSIVTLKFHVLYRQPTTPARPCFRPKRQPNNKLTAWGHSCCGNAIKRKQQLSKVNLLMSPYEVDSRFGALRCTSAGDWTMHSVNHFCIFHLQRTGALFVFLYSHKDTIPRHFRQPSQNLCLNQLSYLASAKTIQKKWQLLTSQLPQPASMKKFLTQTATAICIIELDEVSKRFHETKYFWEIAFRDTASRKCGQLHYYS